MHPRYSESPAPRARTPGKPRSDSRKERPACPLVSESAARSETEVNDRVPLRCDSESKFSCLSAGRSPTPGPAQPETTSRTQKKYALCLRLPGLATSSAGIAADERECAETERPPPNADAAGGSDRSGQIA